VFPDYEPTWRHKLVRSAPTGGMIVFWLVVERPDGVEDRRRMPSEAYRALLSATNMKQRVRKLLEYTWADRLHYAVAGTPNLLEYDQGFFVKGGDGLADLKPIAGLYKGQVYALARFLELPEGISGRAPTTETFSLPQTQEEFYFGYPYEQMDLLVWGETNGVPAAEVAAQAGLGVESVEAAYWEIARRREATAYLHAPAVVLHAEGAGG
jgi:NAD+ synthase